MMNKFCFSVFFALLFTLTLSSPLYAQQNGDEPLAELAQKHKLAIGTAVNIHALRNDPTYRETLAREYNMVTPENSLKMRATQPQQGQFSFGRGDDIVEFAEDNNMQIRGHALLWHDSVPDWVEEGEWTREEAIEIIRSHINEVVTRYKNRIFAWDVVNEAFEDDGSYRESIWYELIGPEYIDIAFQAAHEADPNCLLFYNDYSTEGLNKKSDAVYSMARRLLNRDIPLHGIGLQTHIRADTSLPPYHIARNIDRLDKLGLQVHITELDIRVPLPVTEENLQQQANTYRNILNVALDQPACTAFITWGFTDKYSWVPGFFDGFGAALPFDENFEPKPAYQTMQTLLNEKEVAEIKMLDD